jgi:hypothetical protein
MRTDDKGAPVGLGNVSDSHRSVEVAISTEAREDNRGLRMPGSSQQLTGRAGSLRR